jgi:AcrR family transcriptional regulator
VSNPAPPPDVVSNGDAGLLPAPANPPRRERSDAARNRALVLAAADNLFRERDPRAVTMEDICRAAGVGRATLYRRFPDVRSIAIALLDRHERDLQERLMRGVPPLGPGAPPRERLTAFYRAMVELLERFGHLLLSAEGGSARFDTGAYQFWSVHVRVLLADAGVPNADELTDVLLAPLAPELYHRQRHDLGRSPEHIGDQLAWLAGRVLG